MKYTATKSSPTVAELTVTLDAKDFAPAKEQALARLAKQVKVPGFRPGKIPPQVAEKHIDQGTLQGEVLEMAANTAYVEAMVKESLQPLDNPKISIKKFVPNEMAEFTVEVVIVPEIKVADYHNIKKTPAKVVIGDAEIQEVIDRLQKQMAEKKEVDRAAKEGDEAIINFSGKDADGKPVQGATGTDYPLSLGSKTFIDGFEDNVVGMKPSDKKDFTLTFPKDYGHKALANKDVTFSVEVKRINELVLPEVNDEFAKKVGPFESLDDLKKDIKEELTRQQEQNNQNEFKNALMEEIAEKSDVPLPEVLVKDQERMVRQDMLQNLAYRGQTLEDHLKAEGLSEDDWLKKEVTPLAEKRVATGLILAEIAKQEKIKVSDEDIAQQIELMKQQLQDPKMQAQLNTEEARRDISSRLATEKTLEKLMSIVTTAK